MGKCALALASDLPVEDKDDAKENLVKLTEELKDQKRPGIITRNLERIAQVVLKIATILAGSEQIVELLKQVPKIFGGNS